MYLGAAEKLLTDDGIRHIVGAVQRYHYASLQDKNPVVAARHNGYAVALAELLLDLAPPADVKRATGIDPQRLKWDAVALQDKHENLVFRIIEKLQKRGITLEMLSKDSIEKILDRF